MTDSFAEAGNTLLPADLKPKDETLTDFRPGFSHSPAKQLVAGDPMPVREDLARLLSPQRV